MTIKFSVVINTYNRANLLKDTLLSLSELQFPSFEVIVVNGPSTDKTEEILKCWKHKIKIGKCDKLNLSMSRNIGIEMSAGDVIAFIDDDAIPHPIWLDKLAPHYRNPRIGGVGGFTIDNTGIAYQVRKTICDRFGNAYWPSDFFDERLLSFPSCPFYPSLLGTNSSFRVTALREIGGFDHTFAYLLDETDVCLRLIDRGYQILYEPDALIYHQFAPSHIRNKDRVAKTLYPSAVSKSYFIRRHGNEQRAAEELQRYETEILNANKWLADHGKITHEHRASLDDDLRFGIREGTQRALQVLASDRGQQGDLELQKLPIEFFPMRGKLGLRIAFVNRSFLSDSGSGIVRWTEMMANGLANIGHKIHVITLAPSKPYTRFENGYWVHAIEEDKTNRAMRMAMLKSIPFSIASWCSAVEKQVRMLKGFGLEVVSFPIWDVEGMAIADDNSIGIVMSLHTSYAMAKPFKSEWNRRPLFEHFHVNKVIAAESKLLKEVPYILANSEAIVNDMAITYRVELKDRVAIVPHGTSDPFGLNGNNNEWLTKRANDSALKITYIGRFESRKGFDIACAVFSRILRDLSNIEISIIGDTLDESAIRVIKQNGASNILTDTRVQFKGTMIRECLDQAYLSSDIVVMPSRYESFGLVAIEAMAAAVPVIGLETGGLKEVIDNGSTGFLVKLNADVVGEIVIKLKQLVSDPVLLLSMKNAARKAFIDRYKIEHMVEAAEKIYFKAARRNCEDRA